MPPKRVFKKAKSTSTTYASITVQDSDKLTNTSSETPPSDDPFSPSPLAEDSTAEKAERIAWSEEMTEQLVEVVYAKWEEAPGACDNGMKRDTWTEGADRANQVRKVGAVVTWDKAKNKWGDLKIKYRHWVKLSEMSGFGFNPDTGLYEAFDYVWDNLNKSEPNIIWHKTHIMPFRDMIGEILQEETANGGGALTATEPTPLDPRLVAFDTTTLAMASSSSTSPALTSKPKTQYNKSKRKVRTESADDEDKRVPAKKVDLGAAISSLAEQMDLARKAKEQFLTNQQKAVQLLESLYKKRLDMVAFIKACVFFKDEGNSSTFIILEDEEFRDRFLEINLGIELYKASI
jgi:hypothetical protein